MAEPVFIEKSPHHDFHSDEQFNTEPDESMTLADLYSRMPPPPPRPPSVASLSSRTSNNNRPLSSVSLASSYQTQSNPAYGLTPPSPRVAMEMAQRDRDSKHSLLNEEQRQSWQSLTQSKDVSVSARSSLRRSLSNDPSGNGSSSNNRRRTSRRDNDLKGIGIERVPLPSGLSTSSSLTSGLTLSESSPSVKVQSQVAKKDERNLRNRISGGIEGVKKFVVDLGNAILMLLMGFIWPALLSLLGSLTPIPQTPSKVSPLPSEPRPVSTAASSTASPAAGPGSLAERFKYAICTSFLLAPSISISFYDDAPPLVNDPDADAEAEAEIETYAKRKIRSHSSANQETHSSPSSQDERTQAITSCVCRSLNATLPPSPSTFILVSDKSRNPNSISTTSNLPTLTPLGSQLRTSSMLACIAYRFLTSSWEAWFQAVLLLSCLVWSVYLTPSLGLTVASEDQLRFSLSLAPQPELLRSELGRKAQAYIHPGSPPRSLLRYAIPGRLTPRDKATLASEAVKSARDLVLAAHAFDRSVNAGIGAIQEVELVARGYRITHPLPPISRIEAGSSSLGAYHSSPPRSRSPYGSAPPNGSTSHQDARLSNASAFSLTSGKKQHSRPMSFSGLPSPAGLGEAEAQSFASQQEPRRLAGLRSSILEVLSSADRICRSSKSQLSSLVEKEELGLLSEMYSLDGSSNGDGLTHSASVGSSLADNNGRNEHQQPSSDVEELEDNRISWSSGGGGRGVLGNNWQTTPRNFGSSSKRISLLNESPFDLSHPPSINNSKQKRLSLLSDGSAADREKERERGSVSPVPPGTRSNRNSLLLDSTTSPKIGSNFGGSIGKRGSRLGYVSDGVSKAGPNESAASKRLSYTSSTNSPNPIRSNYSPSATASFGDTSATSIATGTGTQDTSVSGKRLSLLGLSPNAPFNTESTSPARSAMAPTPSPLLLDPQSLLSLKSNFESFHSTRRRTLCHLLALDFTLSDKVTGGEKEVLDMELQEYWVTILQSMQDMIRCFEDQKIIIDQQVKSAFDLGNETGATSLKSGLLAPPGQSESGTSKGAFGHMGLEDRIGVMAVSLRALQSKLSACSEDLHLKSPSHLHGDSTPSSSLTEAGSSKAEDPKSNLRNDAELSAKQDQVERVFESIQEELLSLSAEWEAGLKILKREKVRAASPSLPEHLRPSSATRGLDSPQEVEEDALNSNKPWRKSDSTSESSDGPPDPPSGHSLYSLRRLEGKDGTSETLVPSNLKSITNETAGENGLDDEMSDLAQLLLNSTSPDHLPPPGLEQVFESIAGMADSNFKKDNLSKMTREERIKIAKEQRAAALIQQNAKREKANREESEGVEPLGMVRELKDVIKARRESRLLSQSTNTSSHSGNVEQHQQQPQPSIYELPNSSQHQNQIQLGSPLELESTGTFSSNSASISSILSAKLAASSGSNSTSTSPLSSTLQTQDQSPVITSSPTNSNASRSRPRKSSETANRNRQSVVMDTQVMNNKVWRHSQDLLNGFNRESLDQNSRDHLSQTNANP